MPTLRSRLRPANRAGGGRGWTIRLRLTALYGVLFVISGAILLGVTYLLVAGRLHNATLVAVSNATGNGPTRREVIAASGGPVPLPAAVPPGADGLIPQFNVLARHQRNDSLHLLLVVSLVALALMVIASMGLGWIVAGRALQPLRAMTTAALQLSEENLHE